MRRVLVAGAAYFAIVFAAGFALGTLRTLVILPAVGETGAVALELPVMLMICWSSAGVVVRRWPLAVGGRIAVGLLAFSHLQAAELGLFVFAFGRDLAGYMARLATLPGALGLVGQLAFAAFPAMRRQAAPRGRSTS